MFELLAALGLAALPALLILLYVRRLDRARPEPLGLIGKSVLYGFLAVIPAAFIEFLLDRYLPRLPGLGGVFIEAFLVAGLVEESVKLFFLRRYLWRRKEFDEAADGIVYAVCVSLGFAIVENFFYGYGDFRILLLRSVTAVPLHALAAGTMGYYLGLEKLAAMDEGAGFRVAEAAGPAFMGGWRKGLGWAVLIHGLYDFFLMTGNFAGFLVLPLLAVAFRVLRRLYRRALDLDEARSRRLYQGPPTPIL